MDSPIPHSRKSPRDRRLHADHRSVQDLAAESSIFSFLSAGNPPQRYRMIFSGVGVYRDQQGVIQQNQRHEVLVELGASYPRMVPHLAWQTPIFHPNISNNGVVCLGGYGTHWVPSLTLSEMCTMLWDMLRYKNYDTESPYNREAAAWAKQQTHLRFPLDSRSIRDRIGKPQPPVVTHQKAPSAQTGFAPPATSDIRTDNTPQRRAVVSHVPPVTTGSNDGRPPITVTADGIEIIETGIQIIESNVEPPPIIEIVEPQDGILFID